MFDPIRDLALTMVVMEAATRIPEMEAARAALDAADDKTIALAAALIVTRTAEKEAKALIDSGDPGDEMATEVIAQLVTSVAALLDIVGTISEKTEEAVHDYSHPVDCPFCEAEILEQENS